VAEQNLRRRESPFVIPETARNLQVSCRWCGWRQYIERDASVRHACHALNDVLPVTREPALILSWSEAVPFDG
jgi:hypothetical protein